MTGQQYEEIESLAAFIGASPEHVHSLAQLVAGDEPLMHWSELTQAGAAELLANLKLYDTYGWWDREMVD
jgi:hypothetical protein